MARMKAKGVEMTQRGGKGEPTSLGRPAHHYGYRSPGRSGPPRGTPPGVLRRSAS